MKKYKERLQSLRKLLRTDLNDLEKRVVKSTIVDEEKKYSETLKSMKDDYSNQQRQWKQIVSKMETKRKKKYARIRKTVRKMISEKKREKREEKKEEMKLRKILRHQNEYEENIRDELVLGLIDKYKEKMNTDLTNV